MTCQNFFVAAVAVSQTSFECSLKVCFIVKDVVDAEKWGRISTQFLFTHKMFLKVASQVQGLTGI